MNTANTGNTVNGLWQPVCHALWNFDSTGLCVLLAGKAHCAMPILRAREYGLVRTCTDLYGPSFAGGFGGQAAQGYVGAMRSGNSKAQGAEEGIEHPCATLTHGARP